FRRGDGRREGGEAVVAFTRRCHALGDLAACLVHVGEDPWGDPLEELEVACGSLRVGGAARLDDGGVEVARSCQDTGEERAPGRLELGDDGRGDGRVRMLLRGADVAALEGQEALKDPANEAEA